VDTLHRAPDHLAKMAHTVAVMATKKIELGPTSERVRLRVAALRERRRLTLAQLSDRLTHLGHPLGTTAISRIEQGDRRVDVDDLVALAAALNVSPLGLLLPHEQQGHAPLTEDTEVAVDHLWRWANGTEPLSMFVFADEQEAALGGPDELHEYLSASSPFAPQPTQDRRVEAALTRFNTALASLTRMEAAFVAAVEDPESRDRAAAALAVARAEEAAARHDADLARRDADLAAASQLEDGQLNSRGITEDQE